MIKIPVGKRVKMTVTEKTDQGYILLKDSGQALLPYDQTDKTLKIDEPIEVFLYNDKKGKIIATTTIPDAQIDQYGWAEVAEVLPIGAFVNIGIAKEVLVPRDHLPSLKKVWPKPGNQLYVKLDTDKQDRLLAIPASEDVFIDRIKLASEDMHNQQVSGIIYLTRREGAACITDQGYRGFIHHTERKEDPCLGDRINGRVIHVKEDGTLNISLLPYKKEGMREDAEMILEHLERNKGMIPFSDQSDPADIRDTFQISKAAFKRALGKLMKEGKVEQRDGNTYLK